MKKLYHIEVCRCFNNRQTDRWFVTEYFIPSLYEARQCLADYAGGLEYPSKHDECMNARPYEIVLADGQTFDMCDTMAFRIVEAI